MGNIHVKLFEIWTSGSGEELSLKKKFTYGGRMHGRQSSS